MKRSISNQQSAISNPMCGICGVIHFDNSPVAKHDLERMVKTIHHRGPDDCGVWADGNVGLGNTRLAII
ncbi:MAG: hypothetical protein AABZ78_11670, partial [Chloroflexota bacterium]